MTLITAIPQENVIYFAADMMNTRKGVKTPVRKIMPGPTFLYSLSGTVTDDHCKSEGDDFCGRQSYEEIVWREISKNWGQITIENFNEFVSEAFSSLNKQFCVNVVGFVGDKPLHKRYYYPEGKCFDIEKNGEINTLFQKLFLQESEHCHEIEGTEILCNILSQGFQLKEQEYNTKTGFPLNQSPPKKRVMEQSDEKVISCIRQLTLLSFNEIERSLVAFYKKLHQLGANDVNIRLDHVGLGVEIWKILPDNSFEKICDKEFGY